MHVERLLKEAGHMAHKGIGIAIALLFFGVGTLYAAEDIEETRVNKLQNEFQSGKIGFCVLLWFKDSSAWMVDDDPHIDHVRLMRIDRGHDPEGKILYFNDRDTIAQITKVDRETMHCARD
jgi:hypothetical protein